MNRASPQKHRYSDLSVAGIAATAAIISSALTWYGVHQSVRQTEATACVQRLDLQEAKIREKAEVFLMSIGEMVGRTSDLKLTDEGFHQASEPVIKSAFAFTAYTPPELGLPALQVANVVRGALVADTEELQKRAIANAMTAMGNWPGRFYELMNQFEQKRQNCQNGNAG
ncbi:hypothetical protein [Pseudomonas brassicacearum]|uniref:Uncharacterized protein n=1 Tax=Pseudomonas brassicacearum TaxID=930166 RepID=A0A423J7S3_9PSED|nr:hypothetical protein [Pseudomonas brassicacearum]RON33714.1 hypothetical protein BK664_24765 [Pseudomonas brassicacearum]